MPSTRWRPRPPRRRHQVGLLVDQQRQALRTIGWSSTTKTRAFITSPSRVSTGNEQVTTVCRGPLDLERAADHGGAVAHDVQAHPD